MGKIVVLNAGMKPFAEELRAAAPGYEFVFCEPREAQDELPDAEVVLDMSPEVEQYCLDNESSKLKWLQVISAGVDTLPLAKLEEKGIFLTSASGVHAKPISETIFALMLSLTRGLHDAEKLQAKAKWVHPEDSSRLDEIHDKTIAILGAGKIGREAAYIAKAFGMTVLGMRHSGRAEEPFDEVYTPDGLLELLPRCDYVVNLLPLTEETCGLIGEHAFKAMPAHARYIAVGRGGTTDTAALVHALQTGEIAGAGLDVTDPEPLQKGSPLWGMENVIVLPHIAGMTKVYMRRVADIFAANLKAYTKTGKPDINLVDYARGY